MPELTASRNQLNGWFLKTERTLCALCGQLPFACEQTAFHRRTVVELEGASTRRQNLVWAQPNGGGNHLFFCLGNAPPIFQNDRVRFQLRRKLDNATHAFL